MRRTHLFYIIIIFIFSCSSFDNKQNEDITLKNNNSEKNKFFENFFAGTSWTEWQEKLKTGNPYITNIKLEERYDVQNWDIIQDDNNVMLFANRHGILTYDGQEWFKINTSGYPYKFKKDTVSGNIFVGCSNGFGYLSMDEEGFYEYNSLSDSIQQLGEVTNIEILNRDIFFYSEKVIIKLSSDKLEYVYQWRSEKTNPFTGLVKCKEKLYVNIYNKGIHRFENDLLEEVNVFHSDLGSELDTNLVITLPEKANLSDEEIIFSIPYNDDYVLIGTDENWLYLFDGIVLFGYQPIDNDYIIGSVLAGGIDLSDDEMALATLTGGCLIISKSSGKTLSTINYQTGLPDDEIFTLGTDKNKGLWLSHGFGISRVNYSLPIKNFSTYPGIKGNILSIIDFDSTIYISTSEGVFYLSEVKDYKEIEILVKQLKKKDVASNEGNILQQQVNASDDYIEEKNKRPIEDERLKKGWKQSWKERRNKKKQQKKEAQIKAIKLEMKQIDDKISQQELVNVNNDILNDSVLVDSLAKIHKNNKEPDLIKFHQKADRNSISYQYVSDKAYALQSIGYLYKQIDGLDAKCRSLVRYNDRLLAATNIGVYEIKNNKLSKIIDGYYVNCISQSISNIDRFFIGTNSGIFSIYFNSEKSKNKNKDWIVEQVVDNKVFNEPVYSITEDKNMNLWLGGEDVTYRILANQKDSLPPKPYNFYNDFPERIFVNAERKKPVFYLSSGIYGYHNSQDLIYKRKLHAEFVPISKSIFAQKGYLWLSKGESWKCIGDSSNIVNTENVPFNLFDDIQQIYVDNQKNLWIIDGNNSLFKLYLTEDDIYQKFNIFVKRVASNTGTIYTLSDLVLNHEENAISFNLAAPFYLKKQATRYQYTIAGLINNWSEWSSNPVIEFPYLPSGNYKLKIRAKNILDHVSETEEFNFSIKAPFWKTYLFYAIVIFILMLAIATLMKIRERKLQRAKDLLENKVKERTAEIEKQKQRVMDSIKYASRIQSAVLPQFDFLNNVFSQHFILNIPRDIVSGDFYWIRPTKDNKIVVAAADCTGHGVPGAFLSMLGISFMNEIVIKENVSQANEILNRLRTELIGSLHQTGKKGEAQDGIDIALYVIDMDKMKLQFAGAHNPLYLIRNNEVDTFKGDKMPIGIHRRMNRPFQNYEIDLKKNDCLYVFSDGYTDQFGGNNQRKFYLSKFRDLLIDINSSSMEQQKQILNNTLNNWRGDIPQVDDILVIGVRI